MSDKIEFTNSDNRLEYYSLEDLEALFAQAEVDYKFMLTYNLNTRDSLRPGKPAPLDPSKYLYYNFQYWRPNRGRWVGLKEIKLTTVATEQRFYPKGALGGPTSSWVFNRHFENLDWADAAFTRVLQKNAEFMRRIKKLNFKSADYFSWPIATVSKGVKTYSARLIYKNNKNECDRCGVEVNPARLVPHQRTIKCAEDMQIVEAKKRGFEFTRDKNVMKAIRDGIVMGEAVPVDYKIFAPKWVIQASEKFGKDKAGYAGMTFEEYISGLKEPDDELPSL